VLKLQHCYGVFDKTNKHDDDNIYLTIDILTVCKRRPKTTKRLTCLDPVTIASEMILAAAAAAVVEIQLLAAAAGSCDKQGGKACCCCELVTNINGVFTRFSKCPAIHVYFEYIC